MGGFGSHKAVLAMIVLQCITASVTLFSKIALSQGMSPFVFVAYRQIIATVIMAPLALISRWRNRHKTSFGLWTFVLILITSLIGVTANNNTYFEGLSLSSSSVATAMLNLIPAITFVMATMLGLEKIDLKRVRSFAKIIGTLICIGGGICMALVKGPELFVNAKLTQLSKSLILLNTAQNENLPLGCLFLFLNCCCNSFWIVMQVPISEACPDHFYTTFWMFLLSSAQSITCTFIVHRKHVEAWVLHSSIQIGSCLFAAMGEALSFFIQVWCISQTGPVFAVMFTPLSTVFATIIDILVLNQSLYVGSLLGAFAVIFGLYAVLFGKANDLEKVTDNDNQRETLDLEMDGQTRECHLQGLHLTAN